VWRPVDDPFGDPVPSTLVACLPIVPLPGLIAATATNWFGQRFVFKRSIILACLVGGLVKLQANVFPFTKIAID